MRRRSLLASLPSAAALAPLARRWTAPPPVRAAGQPNFVVLMADDMDARMLDSLPHLRALTSARGMTFANAYTAAPVCCPARAAFLRGQYPHNTGVLANGGQQGGFDRFRSQGLEQSTIATWLQDAGYRTGLIGKYLNDYEKSLQYIAPGWDRWFVYGGLGKYTSYRVSDQGKVRVFGKDKDKDKGKGNGNHKGKHHRKRKKKGNKGQYQTTTLANKALDFIASTPVGQPFFLYLAPSSPHEPATPAQRHKKAQVAANGAPRVPSFNEADVADKPALWSRGPMSNKNIATIDAFYVKQLRCMIAVEEMLDAVINALAADGRLSNTYIIFTSDNGLHHGEHRIGLEKNTPFEESTRAPFTISGPGIPSGVTSDALVSLIDIAPTLVELAGQTAPDFIDGRSMQPLLQGDVPANWRTALLSELLQGPGGGFTLLRAGDAAYTAYGDGARDLYDLADDPFQLENIYSSAPPAETAVLEDTYTALKACGRGAGQTCQSVDGGA